MLDVNNFEQLSIKLATATSIRKWSNGEVKKPETINYRTLKPERDGLFCEKIFGPTKDWECGCGKYKRIRFKGIICEKCGVEVTRSKVRRERMGHVELAAPAVHIWYLRGTRSWLAYLLMGTEPKEELKAKQLEKVVYFAANMVIKVHEERRKEDLKGLKQDMQEDIKEIKKEQKAEEKERKAQLERDLKEKDVEGVRESEINNLHRAAENDLRAIEERFEKEIEQRELVFKTFSQLAPRQIIESEKLWNALVEYYEDYFEGGTGAEAVSRLIAELSDKKHTDEETGEKLDTFQWEQRILQQQLKPPKGGKPLSAQRKQKAIKRLKILVAFNQCDEHGRRVNEPHAMILNVVPVIPPDLRPMVQLDGGRFATSDLNDLYRRVINRNNRLKRLLDLGAPDIIVNNEKRMLQEAVDALFDNGRRGRAVNGPGNRPLKSLSDMLKGKQGRFRQNLLGKRVDYSARSVIVSGPTLKLHQCGLPKIMALELFKPFVMKKLVDENLALNIKSAKRMVERRQPQVWNVLEDVIQEHPVLLNRAPTLHRLGIQAFEPVLVEGKAIQIHPLVCTAFNADFDGDQMAVHLPLSAQAQAEARILMLSSNNMLSPANGRPLVTPTQDMITGAYYLTLEDAGEPGEGRVFRRFDQVERAYEAGEVSLHTFIEYRIPELLEAPANGAAAIYERTTVGRVFFNRTLPDGFPYVNHVVAKRHIGEIVDQLAQSYSKAVVAKSLDAIKNVSFDVATRSGLTVSVDDVKVPLDKQTILDRYEKEAERVEAQFRRGVITDGERRQKEVEIWTEATEMVRRSMEQTLSDETFNPINMMVDSGARGNMMQVRQIAGMRGLVANPRGDMIPRPIKSNFREGLKMLEYFIATPGARKGLVDTALRTANAGYLTRRLVDVAQEVIINDRDPFESGGRVRGIWIEDVEPDRPNRRTYLETRLFSRTLADDVTLSDGTVLAQGTAVGHEEMVALRDDTSITRVRVLSPLTDDSEFGISAAAYGLSLATGMPIEVGEAVGVIAAQSIGEPGTQLTMRTFHTGGVAGKDIAGGLPRVAELFEARTPKDGEAVLTDISGKVRITEDEASGRIVEVVTDGDMFSVTVDPSRKLEVENGQEVTAGDPLVEGVRDPKKMMAILGVLTTQQHLVHEVQQVYRDQGVSIHDKHIELIVRQMTRCVAVLDSGDSEFLPGERVDTQVFANTNRKLQEEGKNPASGRPELMGITKASLATDSWLSAASFQETTRVLTEAAIEFKVDDLKGLKENVIIGKLVPAGTGLDRYREVATHAPDHQQMAFYSSDEEDLQLGEELLSDPESAGLHLLPTGPVEATG